MNYFPASGGGSNLKYYVDGVQKKLKGYKVYNVPPVFDDSVTAGDYRSVVVNNNHIHFFKNDTHQKVTDDGIKWLAKLPYTVKTCDVYSFDGEIHLFYATAHYVFNENTNTWTQLARTPVHGSGSTRSVVAGSALGELYIQDTGSNYRTNLYKWNKANDTWSSVSPSLPLNYECTGIVEIDGKVCVLYSFSDRKNGYYLNNGTWTSFDIGSDAFDRKNVLRYSGENPHYLVNKDGPLKEYEITLNGVNFIRDIDPLINNSTNLAIVLDGKVHGVGYLITGNGYECSHVIFDDDGKGYFQDNPFDPVMIPIFR